MNYNQQKIISFAGYHRLTMVLSREWGEWGEWGEWDDC